jgi:hypothetical protein
MDYGYEFEKVINQIIGRPNYVTYANNWSDKDERTALLFTACIIKYDNSSDEDGKKLEYYMEALFEEKNEDKKISIECVKFLKDLK